MTLEDQVKLLDIRVYDQGIKATQIETKQLNAVETLRQTQTNFRTLKLENQNLQNIIDCHEREKQLLICDLKKFSRGKIRSNILEA